MTRENALRWAVVLCATVVLGLALGAAGLPSPYLFAALFCGLAAALRSRPHGATKVPAPAFALAQALCGVLIGAYLQPEALASAAGAWLPIAAVSLATLVLCVVSGRLLANTTGLDRPTAAAGTIAGGASGIVAMATDLGADDRLVAFMQYLRVLIVVLLTPVITLLVFTVEESPGAVPAADWLGSPRDWAISLGATAAGLLLGRLVRIPTASLLAPLAVAALLTLTGALGDWSVPPLLQEACFIAIGLHVGLGFTYETVRTIGRLFFPVLASILVLIVCCIGLAIPLAAWTDATLLDAYLATTPGGLYAVLAVAYGVDANTTFILAVQVLRLVAMITCAPLVVRLVIGRGGRSAPPRPPAVGGPRRSGVVACGRDGQATTRK